MGPLVLDCQQETLLPEEKEKLAHPVTGGVILFSRNYVDKAQLAALVADIRKAAGKPLLIAVDHEGGRVQRFRQGFTALPAMGNILSEAKDRQQARELAHACGVIMAYELKALDIDLSFAPVLDLNGVSEVIRDRAFSDNTDEVIMLADALIDGLHLLAMPATGKHFPGHGSVQADSHIDVPVDERDWDTIEQLDLKTFSALIRANKLDAMMPAHVVYPQIDNQPAGFSSIWLQQILRQKLSFNGLIFSDDLSMEGARVAGDYPARARAALDAGCDMLLACNNPAGAEAILDSLSHQHCERLPALLQCPLPDAAGHHYKQAIRTLSAVWPELACQR
ncbi:beta-N-acetylhexosaminidase [Alteromonas halophila]|uniref:Beta-hexosaminidase n=1 Tax=Alteromonas halophila TaxID=516698 RepID=A0A918JE24_9ALTE|nr:beta-N-acetylhexosaminidase [Alteromonas halophila]GGW76448.1 beta-hexosaminidase [Alteromonas halophila]